jgi:hypothetical protein
MPLDLGLRKIGQDVVVELASGFEIVGTAVGTLLWVDVVFDEEGTGWRLRPKEPWVLAVFLATPIGLGTVGVLAAVGGALAAPADGLEVVLKLRLPAAQLRVFRFQLGDSLLKRGHAGQDGGWGLRWDRVPEWCRDRPLRNHTLYYEDAVQRVRPRTSSVSLENPRRGSRTT